ncbi:hypothetical protein VaNZ11_002095 [Volvox africanus]|uniref:EGF-like domain-containing protein n=1 Tax=Volvox africanus TaxID=51714 RepID=A0ABQ5RR37_9CHLO|nr:hypothetical protein VaNZ11_002095 [Volvox africanus]
MLPGESSIALLVLLLPTVWGSKQYQVERGRSGANYLDLEGALPWLGLDTDQDLMQGPGAAGDPDHSRQLQQLQHPHIITQSSTSSTFLERRAREKRCRGTMGGWCGGYEQQQPVPLRPAPRGNRNCPRNCSGVGNCNYDTGTCDCPAGSQGEDCGTVLLRPCTNSFRVEGANPAGHIDDDGRDLRLTDPGYTESRCTGICDPVTARCFCDGKYRRVNPPKGSPPGTPAPVRGRPLGNHVCQVSDDGKGNKLEWGQVPWEQIYGPDGWCNSDTPVITCGCLFDGFSGPLCDEVTETMCPNQCSGHGECDSGFCKCHEGWYGTDCARKVAGQPMEPGLHEADRRPWLAEAVRVAPEAAAAALAAGGEAAGAAAATVTQPGLKQARRRPLIYVYDLPPAYNARMLQYRNDKGLCTWRSYNSGNRTEVSAWTYGLEVLFHEMLLQSDHRTFDPETADYFYVPMYSSCFIFPLHCYADGPWWHVPSGPRVMHVTNMMLEIRDWIRKHFPYWDRRGGRDHIWLMTHDEGACYAPTEIYGSSIFLTHWGRTDLHHESNTAFTPDNYTQEYVHPEQPKGWMHLIQGHPCYTPGKDLVIPALKLPHHFRQSPLVFHPPRERNILLYLRGDVGKHRLPNYSRGIRQRLYQLWKDEDWRANYNVMIGDGGDIPGDYSEHLASSKFCLVVPGDGWSPRLEDAVLHGCIPVVIMDGVRAVWEDQLEFERCSIRVGEQELEGLPQQLAVVPQRVVEDMQRRLRKVWHRYAYVSHPILAREMNDVLRQNVQTWRQQMEDNKQDLALVQRITDQLEQRAVFPAQDDAFHTVLQWLYWRIPDTR